MEENRQFDMGKYTAGSEVHCDDCGKVIEMDGAVYSRIIAKDPEGFDVVEQYLECQHCGKHYTVMVYDREMKKMIQRRQQLRKQIALNGSVRLREQTVRKWQAEDERIKKKQLQREDMLKRRYRRECAK